MKQEKVLCRRDNRGLSLVELLVSIVMLAIIAVPLLSYFSSAAGYNARAKQKQTAVELAQSMLEQAKDNRLEEVAGWFHSTDTTSLNKAWLVNPAKLTGPDSVREVKLVAGADGSQRVEPIGAKGIDGSYKAATHTFENSADGMLYYAVYDINENGTHYDALVTFNTNQRSGDSYFAQNSSLISDIKAIKSPENVAAVEGTQLDMAVNEIYSRHMTAVSARAAAGESVVLLSEAQIRAALARNMVIELTPDISQTDRVRVRIYYEYYVQGSILGCPDETSPVEVYPPLYQESVALDKLKNIYLFFNRSNSGVEKVKMNIISDYNVLDSKLGNLNLYFICQADEMGNEPSNVKINLELRNNFTKIESIHANGVVTRNLDATPLQKEYITTSPRLRLMNVKVDIYKAGQLLNPQDLQAELESSKGE